RTHVDGGTVFVTGRPIRAGESRMSGWMRRFALFVAPVALLGAGLLATSAGATHSWGEYHWARTSNPFTLKLGDNVSSTWDPILATTSSDWSKSSVLDTTIVNGSANPRTCKATKGMVQVCDASYGNNGY